MDLINKARHIIFKFLRIIGLHILVREIIQKNRVTILMFHDMNKEAAKQTFSYLSREYNIISLDKFIKANKRDDDSKLPKKALIITFDDGHIRNYKLLPVFRRFDIPATIFLCASIVDTNRHFWFSSENRSVSSSDFFKSSYDNWYDYLSASDFLKSKEFQKPQALQKNHIEEMKEQVDFQSHTLFHPILSKCSERGAKKEIFQSKKILEKKYGLDITAISYPLGKYSAREISLAKQAGYECGVTVDFGYNTVDTDIFKLKRFSVNDTDNMDELVIKASGVWGFLKNIHKKFIKNF